MGMGDDLHRQGDERRDTTDLQRWMQERFDRIDDQMDRAIRELADEIKATRHATRGSMEQLTVQVVELVQETRHMGERLVELERKTSEDGPIDQRFRRHDKRLVEVERSQENAGKFTWGDVWKTAAGLAATTGLVGGLFAVARILATTGHAG